MSIDDKFVAFIKSGDFKVERTVTGRIPTSPQLISFDLADEPDKANYCIAHLEGDNVVVDHVGTITEDLASRVAAQTPLVADIDFSALEDRVAVRILKGRDDSPRQFRVHKNFDHVTWGSTTATGRIASAEPAHYEVQKDGIKRIPND